MATRRKKQEPEKADITVSNCHIEMHQQVAANAIEAAQALANAASENAKAISAVAEILKPSQAPSYGIYLQGA